MLDVNRKKIISLMTLMRMDIRDLARLSGVSEGNVRKIVMGNRRPRFSTVGKLASALQVDVLEILKEV